MAFKLDNDLLEELGLAALSADEKQAMLRQILETLEMRVGTTLASKMTDAQLDEFERLMPSEADAPEAIQQKEQQALQWLESNFPNYKQVVNDELEKLKSEIRQSAPHIVAASQQNAVAASSATPTDFNSSPVGQGAAQAQPSYLPPSDTEPSVISSSPAPMPPAQSPQPQPGFMPPQQQPAPGFAPPGPSQQQPPYQPMPPTDEPSQSSQYPPQAA